MIMNNSIGAAALGATGGGLVTGGLLAASVAAMDPSMPQAIVLIGSAFYGGLVCGGLVGAVIGIGRSERGLDGTNPMNPQLAFQRAA
jgi:hypothetical protein